MSQTLLQELIEAGVHFGHQASRWNPKMAPYIYARKNLIHVIDVRETIRGLLRAKKYLTQVAADGGSILFVGTKRQAGSSIEREADRCGMPYISERWLGGTLTNFRIVTGRVARLIELEEIRGGDELATYSKKMQASLSREFRKMYRNLNGIRNMKKIPTCLVVIDPKREKTALAEARKLNVPTVSLIDTDCDPDQVSLPIPGNDDGIRSIEVITRHLADAIIAGRVSAGLMEQQVEKEEVEKEEAAAE